MRCSAGENIPFKVRVPASSLEWNFARKALFVGVVYEGKEAEQMDHDFYEVRRVEKIHGDSQAFDVNKALAEKVPVQPHTAVCQNILQCKVHKMVFHSAFSAPSIT